MVSSLAGMARLSWLPRLATALMSAEAVFVVIQTITGFDALTDILDVAVCVIALGALAVLACSDVVERRLGRALRVDADDLAARRHQDSEESAKRRRRRERIENVLDGQAYPVMVFQPIVDVRTEEIVGFESLARFGPKEAPPNVWFEQATSVGLGVELELKAVRRALAQLHDLPDERQYLSVNCSPVTLMSTDLYNLLALHDAHRIVVELTEHVPVEDYQHCRAALERLRDLGIRLAIDDLGAGYSSMRHVIELRPEIIQLDRFLIETDDSSAQSMVQVLVSVTALTGSAVLAEGIENEAALGRVRQLGVTLGQGWHFGHPAALPTRPPLTPDPPDARQDPLPPTPRHVGHP
jgi:EAL domain-containing protein (putative c-di-GMP-specific phosphodiesterase class I)